MSPGPKLARLDAVYLGLLALAVVALFWPALISPEAILYPTYSQHSDLLVIHWPKAYLMRQAWLADGSLPRWTPLILSGMPLAANQLAMQAYPPAWLLLVIPLNPGFNFLFIFHLLLAGGGTYLFLRLGLSRSRAAALLGGLTFMLSGKILAHAAGGHVSLVGAVGWLPWVMWGVNQVLHARLWRWVILAAAALAMQLATHTQIALYTAYLAAAYALWELLGRGWRPRLRASWVRLATIPILAGLLGSAQALPLLELARHSNRSFSQDQASEFALTPLQLLAGLVLPQAQAGHEHIIYLGLAPLLIAMFGLSRSEPRSWFWAGVCLLALIFALGPHTPLFGLVYRLAPGFRWVRTPARILFPATLALAVMAGYGLDRLRANLLIPGSRPRRRFKLAAVAGGGLSLLLGLGLALGFGLANRATLGLAILPTATLAALAAITSPNGRPWSVLRRPAVHGPVLALLIFTDLSTFSATVIRFLPRHEAFGQGLATAAYLGARPGPFRVYSPSYSLPGHVTAEEDLELADGVEPVHLVDYDKFMAAAGGYGNAEFSVTIPVFPPEANLETALQDTEPDLRLLGLLNVRYLASAFPMSWTGLDLETTIEDVFIYRNQHAQPRAWVAHQVVPEADDWLSQLQALPDLAETATIAQSTLVNQPDAAIKTQPGPAAPVTVSDRSPDQLTLQTKIAAPGLLVVSEIWYPGWSATVNGVDRPVQRVDGLLRGVWLDRPGQYTVSLNYDPDSVRIGRLISLATVALVSGGGLLKMIVFGLIERHGIPGRR